MKTKKLLLTTTLAFFALSGAAMAEPPGKGGTELTTQAQFSELKPGDKVALVCKMHDFRKEIVVTDSKSAMELCREGGKAHCDICKKDFKVTWLNPKTGTTNTSMTIVDETGKPCMMFIKAS
jgi:hypothetical protein